MQDIKDKTVISSCSSFRGRNKPKYLVPVYVRLRLEMITGFCEHLGKGCFAQSGNPAEANLNLKEYVGFSHGWAYWGWWSTCLVVRVF